MLFSLLHPFQTALPDYCEPSSPFLTSLSSHLHTCIPSYLALISTSLGALSIISWLFAQLPQIYKNYQLKSTAGLSVYFLVEWCLGDTGNLVGSLLTRQAGWQVIIAAYYVLVDVTLVAQFFWYTHVKKQWDLAHGSGARHHGGGSDFIEGVALPDDDTVTRLPSAGLSGKPSPRDIDSKKGSSVDSLGGRSLSYSNEKQLASSRRSVASNTPSTILPIASPRTILLGSMLCAVLSNAAPADTISQTSTLQGSSASSDPSSTLELVGRIASWLSTVLYLGSRPPQLYKNYCRKSTSGLSPLLFMAAFFGNLFYSMSLLTNPNAWFNFPPYGGGGWADVYGNDRLEWIGRTIPFFLGAAGVLGLDAFMGVQFLVYGSTDEEDPAIMVGVEDEDNGRPSRMMRVRGWMRGWIPSVSPERRSGTENQSLLSRGREGYGTV